MKTLATKSVSNQELLHEVRALSEEVERLRRIVDWEKALEDVPYEEEELNPAVVRSLLQQMQNIQSGKEPTYHFDPKSFRARLAKNK